MKNNHNPIYTTPTGSQVYNLTYRYKYTTPSESNQSLALIDGLEIEILKQLESLFMINNCNAVYTTPTGSNTYNIAMCYKYPTPSESNQTLALIGGLENEIQKQLNGLKL